MADTIFIGLYRTLDQAFTFDESPVIDPHLGRLDGIQLLPNNIYPYIQNTANPDGVELEDWTVEVVTPCGKVLGDITESFSCQPFNDNDGIPQITWQLLNVPIDFGWRMVCLKITQTAGETFYSNPFMLTSIDANKTTRFDYRESKFDVMQSVQLVTWFRNVRNADTINVRTEVSTQITRSKTVQKIRPRRMFTDFMPVHLIERVVTMLESTYVYVNLVRHNLFEAPEITDPQGDANFVELEYLLTSIPTETYDPNYVEPVPPIPAPGDEVEINLKMFLRAPDVETHLLRAKLDFLSPNGFGTVVFGQSYITVNGEVLEFNTALTNYVEETINAFSNYTGNQTLPLSAEVTEFNLRVTDGEGNYFDYFYNGAAISFNLSEINNGTVKTATATITEV